MNLTQNDVGIVFTSFTSFVVCRLSVFKVTQKQFSVSSRLLELSEVFQAWNCTVWNDYAIF